VLTPITVEGRAKLPAVYIRSKAALSQLDYAIKTARLGIQKNILAFAIQQALIKRLPWLNT
jgi:hypothetical protein